MDYAEENAIVLVKIWPENLFGSRDNSDYAEENASVLVKIWPDKNLFGSRDNLDYAEFTVVRDSPTFLSRHTHYGYYRRPYDLCDWSLTWFNRP